MRLVYRLDQSCRETDLATKKTATPKPAPKKAARTKPSAKSSAQSFRARLEPSHNALGWTIARIPFGLEALGKMVRLRVKGKILRPESGLKSKPFPFRT